MEKRKLSPRIMQRVRACAILFLAGTRAQRIQKIADAKGIDLESASVSYTIGALKRAKRQGTARNYAEALEKLEAEQVGDRGSQITKTLSADMTARKIARINRVNKGERFTMDGVHYIYDYDNIVNINGEKKAIGHFSTIEEKEKTEPKPSRVIGTLYAEWEARQKKSDPLESMINDNIDINLKLFFKDYVSRLSKTAKKRLYEIVESTTDPALLMGKGKQSDDPALRRASWGAYTLYSGFTHKESVSGIEFVGLIRNYVRPPIMV